MPEDTPKPNGTPKANDDFPPATWLGYGLDLTQSHVITSIKSTTAAVKGTHCLFNLDEDEGKTKTISGVTWKVPPSVRVTTDTGEASVATKLFHSGSEAIAEFNAKADVAAQFSSVSGSAGLDYANKSTFSSEHSYYLYSYTQDLLQVHAKNWGDHLDEAVLDKAVLGLPAWKSDDQKAQLEYRSLFSRYGSHIIIGASYGAKLSLQAWADITNTESDSDFQLNVKAEYHGVTGDSVSGGADIKSKSSFKSYEKSQNKICNCRGGDTSKATKIEGSPEGENTSTARDEWVQSATTLPDLSSFQVQPIWDVFRESKTEKIRNMLEDVRDAFDWLCANPRHHKTVCAFTVESDWGEFALLSPSATISLKPGQATPPDVVISSTKVHWGKGNRNIKDQATFEFVIENDGSNIDIELSHGSDGDGRGGEGSCTAVIEGTHYDNRGIKGNNSNAQRWYQCAINPAEAPK